MSIIADGFYPTPQNVVLKMVEDLDVNQLAKWRIIDPSAGDGSMLLHLADYIKKHDRQYDYRKFMRAIEINYDLRVVLQSKEIQVIDSDFDVYQGLQIFDMYIMNPKFKIGARHILHAWDIAQGSLIRCLLNAETINNPFSLERKRLLNLIQRYGHITQFGNCFAKADRTTQVDVVMVTLQDKNYKKPSFRVKYDPIKKQKLDFDSDIPNNSLASRDVFQSYEDQFLAMVSAIKKFLEIKRELYFYGGSLDPSYDNTQLESFIIDAIKEEDYDKAYNDFLEKITNSAWLVIFRKTKLNSFTTSKVGNEICEMEHNQGKMAFTAKNMENLFYSMFLSRETIMIQCIDDVFDILTKYHEDNREYVEGWKTNSAYKVARRFILPDFVRDANESWAYITREHILDDIDKALCFISGDNFNEIATLRGSLNHRLSNLFGRKIFTKFFEIKIYKKGTIHFTFLDEFIRTEFNRIVAENRKWLPQKAKMGVYE